MMKCPKCDAVIDDDSTFCEECGCSLKDVKKKDSSENASSPEKPVAAKKTDSESVAVPPASPESPKKAKTAYASLSDLDKIIARVGFCIGIVCVASGLLGLFLSFNGLQSTSFGGDYQTYVYQGIVAVSHQVELLIRMAAISTTALGTILSCILFKKAFVEKD